MRGQHLIAEPFVEGLVLGQLPANAEPDLGQAAPASLLLRPAHERSTDPAALESGIDGNPAGVQPEGPDFVPQSAHRGAADCREGSSTPLEVPANVLFGLPESAARRIQRGMVGEGQLGQPVDLGRGLGPTSGDVDLQAPNARRSDSRVTRPSATTLPSTSTTGTLKS